MSNTKFQKFIKKLFKIENEFTYTSARPMTKKELDKYNSPEEITKRNEILQTGIAIYD